MLHGGVDHGVNGPHEANPTYDLTNYHIHAQLSIYVDGQKVAIPQWGGVATGDLIHTHDATGNIHMHATNASNTHYVTLGDVFNAWKVAPSGGNANAVLTSTNLMNNLVQGEKTLQMFVNGQRTETFQNYQIHDTDSIVLAYSSNPILVVGTSSGGIPIELFQDKTPITVANFLDYVNDGDYANSFFHRYVPGFVLQGGGFKSTTTSFADPSVVNQFTSVATEAQIQNEFDNWATVAGTGASITAGNTLITLPSSADLSKVKVGDRIRLTGRTDGVGGTNMFDITAVNDAANTVTVSQTPTGSSASNISWTVFPKVNLAGTLAMAKLGSSPNSATSQFFINLVNNDSNLDLQNGGFTVFGQILDPTLLTSIAQLNDVSLFTGTLTGGSEVPAVTTSATGSAALALNKGNNEFDLSLTVNGLTQGNITASHIHTGQIGQEGNSFFDLGAGSQYTVSSTQLRRFIDDATFPTTSVSDLQFSRTYVNVHTTANPDGEIRAQLTPTQGGLYSDLPTTAESELVVIETITGEGEVRGKVFFDTDNDGVFDQNEPGRQSFTVFADANNNGGFDSGEKSAATDANGNYVLRLSSGQHTIRLVPTSGFPQTLPSAAYTVNVLIGGEVTGRDFGVFEIPTPTAVNLVDASDTGTSNTDNLTSLNNSSTTKKLQFQVTGVVDGATVRIRSDGILIGETTVPTGSNGTVTVTTDGLTALGDGVRSIVATQTLGSITSQASAALSVTVDANIGTFTSTPPTTAIVGTALSYNAVNADEGQTGFTYTLVNGPSGATLNSSTGVLSWSPAANQTGQHQFDIVASDAAGNTRSQTVALAVTKTPLVKFRLVVTDMNGNPITSVEKGNQFQLRVFVTDVRTGEDPEDMGVFSAYQDVTFDRNLATAAATITHDTTFYTNSTAGTTGLGIIDEVGAFGGNLNPPGDDEFFLYSVNFTSTRSGTLTFTGDAPDSLPAHAIGVYGRDTAIPLDEVDFGRASVQITNIDFVPQPDTFNFDEDTQNNALDVLANDGQAVANLTILSVSSTDHGGTVTIASGGKSLIHTPAANFFGEEHFTYIVSDGGDEAVVSVSVQVLDKNDPPPSVNDTFSGTTAVSEDSTNNALDVLKNELTATNPDQGAPRESLRVSAVGLPSNGGTVTIGSQGGFVVYTPPANFSGTETFTYTITDRSDGTGLTSQATATVTVTNINDPPVATADTVNAEEDSQSNVIDVKANDSVGLDTGETLTITSVGSASRGGTVTIIENGGKVSYKPAANIFGTETFTYTISDGNGGSATGTVTVNIAAKNDPPEAVNDTITVAKNSQNNTINVLTNDLITPDADEVLTISVVTQGSNGGVVEIIENGTKIRYRPANNYLGTETFTYTARDPGGLTDQATVTVTVRDYVPSSLAGFVYVDADNDGVKDTGEQALNNIQITLTGTDDFGTAVSLTATTDANGAYSFANLVPGNYKVKETQPTTSIGGLPVLDGKDTIGSQGGTVANDEFTIDLNENVNGTNNNFGEITGFKVTGTVKSATSLSLALNGVQMQLFAADAQNQATGSALKTTTLNADGTFNFDGVAAGNYVVKYNSLLFLEGGTAQQALTVTNSDATASSLQLGGLQAKYINFRSLLNLTPGAGLFAAVDVSAHTSAWSAVDTGWSGFTQVSVTPTTTGNMLRIEVTNSSGAKTFDEISLTDSRVRTIASEGNNRLLRVMGTSSQFNFRPVTTTGSGEGESATPTFVPASSSTTGAASESSTDSSVQSANSYGGAEGESASSTMYIGNSMTATSHPVSTVPVIVTPGLLDSSSDSLGDNNGQSNSGTIDELSHDLSQDFAMVVDTTQVSTLLEQEDRDSSLTSTLSANEVDAFMSDDSSAVMNDELVNRLAESRTADHSATEEQTLDAVIDELLHDDVLLTSA